MESVRSPPTASHWTLQKPVLRARWCGLDYEMACCPAHTQARLVRNPAGLLCACACWHAPPESWQAPVELLRCSAGLPGLQQAEYRP